MILKNILLALLIVFSVFPLKAQDYIPTLLEGNKWEIRKPLGLGSNVDYSYAIKCDTLIGGENYKMAILSDMNEIVGYYREDTLAEKVYKWNEESETDQLIIDYELSVGDTMEITGSPQVVDSIKYEMYLGKERKFIYFNDLQIFIEGVGYSFCGVHNFGGFQVILNFEEEAEDCTPIVVNLEKVEIYPNPTPGQLYVEGMVTGQVWIIIWNSLGQVVKKEKASNQIDISELETGIYFLRFSEQDRVYKIIKL